MTPREQTKAALLEAVRAEPSPTRREVRRRASLRFGGALLVGLALLLALGGVHVGDRAPAALRMSFFLWMLIAGLLTSSVRSRGRTMLGVARPALLASAILVAPVLAGSWLCLPWGALALDAPRSAIGDATCFGLTLVFGAAPLAALIAELRESDPVRPAVTGAAVGAAAGAWAAALIDAHCDSLVPAHVALGHLVPVVVLVVAGALWGRSALAVRRAERSTGTAV